jgi:hypothetical protein
MNEKFSYSEKNREAEGIVLNKNLFNQLDKVFKSLPKDEVRDIFEYVINDTKKKSFEYLEETLDFILNPPDKNRSKEVMEEEEKEVSHAIAGTLYSIGGSLDLLNIPTDFKAGDREKALRNFKTIALDYALNHVLDYEKQVVENKADSKEVLKKMNLGGVVNGEYLEKSLINKINELPVEIRENLLLVEA